jgi:hypothetical protein
VLEIVPKVVELCRKWKLFSAVGTLVNGVRCVLWMLGVMLCMLFCILLCILEAVEGELRLLEVLE